MEPFTPGSKLAGIDKCTLCTYRLMSVLARFVQDVEWEHPNRYSNPHLLHNNAKDGVEFVKVSEDCWEVLEAVDDVNRLRGIVVSKRAVSVEEMDSAIRHRSEKNRADHLNQSFASSRQKNSQASEALYQDPGIKE